MFPIILLVIIVMIVFFAVRCHHRPIAVGPQDKQPIIRFLARTGIRVPWAIHSMESYNGDISFIKIRLQDKALLSFSVLPKKKLIILTHDDGADEYRHILDQNQFLLY